MKKEEEARGLLFVLETHAWGNQKKIPIEKLDKNTKLYDWVRANKSLISKTALEGIQYCLTRARNTVKTYALTNISNGVFFVPANYIEVLSEKIDSIIVDLQELVTELENNFYKYKKLAQKELESEELFDEADYPEDIGSKFGLSYRIISMGVPGELKALSPDLYRQEVQKYKDTMEDIRQESILFLRESFLKTITTIVNTLRGQNSGEKRRLKQSTLEKIDIFFSELKNKNIFQDGVLQTLVENAREVMVDIDAKDLKKSDDLRKEVETKMDEVKEILEGSIESFKRKITFRK
jgi:hypothetical protein